MLNLEVIKASNTIKACKPPQHDKNPAQREVKHVMGRNIKLWLIGYGLLMLLWDIALIPVIKCSSLVQLELSTSHIYYTNVNTVPPAGFKPSFP